MLLVPASGWRGGAPAYAANAVDLDGTNDFLTRGAGLTGAIDSQTGILSTWVRLDGGDATAMNLLTDSASNQIIRRNGANNFSFDLTNGANFYTFRSTTAYTASGTWRHVLASWNTNFTSGNRLGHLYVNDVSDFTLGSESASAFLIDYTLADWGIGARPDGNGKLNGCLSEFYFAPGQFLDFSVQANRRKFISATGKPVDLGADGSLPTGTAPIIYLNNPAGTFGTNKGTGGNFTVTGTLDTASTSPSD